MTASSIADWIDRLPGLARLEPAARAAIERSARLVTLTKDSAVFHPGDSCQAFLLVLRGAVRVQQVAESGREIVLYRLSPGETCILTTACLLAHQPYAAEGIAESEVAALAIPEACFQRLLAESAAFRTFVFATYAARITDLMVLVQEVAFARIDCRLAHCLLDRGDAAGRVGLTHHELAVELGTAREVVSRQLKAFERRGWIRMERGRLAIEDRAALVALAHLPA